MVTIAAAELGECPAQRDAGVALKYDTAATTRIHFLGKASTTCP
jgi:hypothetical protein